MKTLFLTNIPTPYRNTFYDELSNESTIRGDSAHVLYCATSEPHRSWPYNKAKMKHSHEVLSGVCIKAFGVCAHFNPSVLIALHRHAPDVVAIAGAWNTPTMILALFWCRVRGIPVYFWSEAHESAVLNPRGLIAWIRRLVYGSYSGFLVPNNKSAEWAIRQSNGKRPCLRLPNSIDTGHFAFPHGTKRADWRAKIGILESRRIFVQVARIEALKGPLELARAFMELPIDCRLRATLVFVGTGSLAKDLGDIAISSGGAIILAGGVDASKVREWLWAADVFVLNTKRDNNPLSPIEAAAASLPILLSHLAGNVGELVREEFTGWTIRDTDNPGADLLRAINCTEEQLKVMGENARRLAATQYDSRTTAANLLDQLKRNSRSE